MGIADGSFFLTAEAERLSFFIGSPSVGTDRAAVIGSRAKIVPEILEVLVVLFV